MSYQYPRITDHHVMLKNCALDLFVGNPLGEGSSRSVYALEHDPDKVIKMEYTGKTFHNVVEWKIWEAVKDTPISDWFAECYEIDCWGTALIQRKADVFETEKDFLRALERTRAGHVPDIFDDVRFNNFGLISGTVCCVDYGYSHIFDRMQKEIMMEYGYMAIDAAEDEPKPPRQLHLDL